LYAQGVDSHLITGTQLLAGNWIPPAKTHSSTDMISTETRRSIAQLLALSRMGFGSFAIGLSFGRGWKFLVAIQWEKRFYISCAEAAQEHQKTVQTSCCF
jgi:hypothetical protein